MLAKKKILFLVKFLLVQGLLSNAYAQQWFYVDPIKPSDSFSIQINPNTFGINDVLIEAVICDRKSKYICIEAPGFSFHVPKNLSSSLNSWRINEIEYISHLNKRLQIFGLKDQIFLIDKKEGNNTIRFLFSKKRGLIGIGGFSAKSSSIFLLDIYCGFGASGQCIDTLK
ncbi:hypothetical protein [Methylobacter luteus]|uniref:hypothetical protein n=1 Tax=Methylobacter luteus TaxID=415 RepID=UPI00040168CF|nr:hypothetical protein [Methylobacter luteus]